MIEVIDQYGERHRFDDNHCIHDADSTTGMVQIGVSNDSGDYDVVATFLHPARFGDVSDDTCFTLREVPAGIARQIEELRAENASLASALVAKDEALERCTKFTQEDYDALAIQPHAALVAKIKADAVSGIAQELLDCGFHQQVVEFVLRRADRIERGEV